MIASDLAVGVVINYRGQPAVAVEVGSWPTPVMAEFRLLDGSDQRVEEGDVIGSGTVLRIDNSQASVSLRFEDGMEQKVVLNQEVILDGFSGTLARVGRWQDRIAAVIEGDGVRCRLIFDGPDSDTCDGLNGPLQAWG